MILSHIYLFLGSVISICALSTVSGPVATVTNNANVSRHQMYISQDEVGPFKKSELPFSYGARCRFRPCKPWDELCVVVSEVTVDHVERGNSRVFKRLVASQES